MQQEAEKRWEAALQEPLEGVQFTYEEFADALSKYDFSFEVGDLVRYSLLAYALTSTLGILYSLFLHLSSIITPMMFKDSNIQIFERACTWILTYNIALLLVNDFTRDE